MKPLVTIPRYGNLLLECESCYLQARRCIAPQWAAAEVRAVAQERPEPSALVKAGVCFLMQLCLDEYDLYGQFFSRSGEGFKWVETTLIFKLYLPLLPALYFSKRKRKKKSPCLCQITALTFQTHLIFTSLQARILQPLDCNPWKLTTSLLGWVSIFCIYYKFLFEHFVLGQPPHLIMITDFCYLQILDPEPAKSELTYRLDTWPSRAVVSVVQS